MIICSNCGHENAEGSIFCLECGALVDGAQLLVTKTIADSEMVDNVKQDASNSGVDDLLTDYWLALRLMENDKTLYLSARDEFTLGRFTEGQPVAPDIDLMPYQAYAAGVSRLHAAIRRDSDRVIIMDLGSSNGTYLNGRRLNSHMEEQLKRGDVIALGKLKMQVIV
ncbi:MAG: hypothetical protein B6D38_04705 [Anaerolineae bacterium UTCFX1]|jgi:hypothetical protein|nr:MAG: hypothetical protein B6D38_04705 [Anaerolineae bacterium UTCFX1]